MNNTKINMPPHTSEPEEEIQLTAMNPHILPDHLNKAFSMLN